MCLAKLHLKSSTTSSGCDGQTIDWQDVFAKASDQLSGYIAGEPIRYYCLSEALQGFTSISDPVEAEAAINQAVIAEELRETNTGYWLLHEGRGPDTQEVRNTVEATLQQTISSGDNAVIHSPTSSGKSHSASTPQWREHPNITREQPVIMFSGTRDAREDALEKSNNSSATAKVLEGRQDACPLADGCYDDGNTSGNDVITAPDGSDPSEWFNTMCDDQGLHLSVAHGIFERKFDGELPCCPGGSRCQSIAQWDNIPRTEDDELNYDVLHATHPFARVPQLVEDCNIIFDERPDFTTDLSTEKVRKTVNSYMEEIDGPIDGWADLMSGLTGRLELDLHEVKESLTEPDTDWFLKDEKAHALAPGLVEAIVTAEERNHNRWVGTAEYTYPNLNPQFDGPDQEVMIRVVIQGGYENEIKIVQVLPDFEKARSVVGLDAHPAMAKWKANTIPSIEERQVLSQDDLHEWRRNYRNLHIVQAGDNKNTWTKKDYNSPKVGVLCEELRNKYGDGFRTGVTSRRFKRDLIRDMQKAGVADPLALHYGIEKSVGDFDGERAGVIAGCISPSDEDIKDQMALLGKVAEPEREAKEGDVDGQKWVGPDADVAHQLIRDVREHRVLQAIGRYGRSPDDPDDRATVYVLTSMVPDPFVDEKIDDVRPFGTKQEEIIQFVSEHDGVTPLEITENLDVSRTYVHDTLNEGVRHTWLWEEDVGDGSTGNLYHADRCPSGFVNV